ESTHERGARHPRYVVNRCPGPACPLVAVPDDAAADCDEDERPEVPEVQVGQAEPPAEHHNSDQNPKPSREKTFLRLPLDAQPGADRDERDWPEAKIIPGAEDAQIVEREQYAGRHDAEADNELDDSLKPYRDRFGSVDDDAFDGVVDFRIL